MRWVLRDERGTVTAEFAIVLPAVLIVLGLVVSGVLLAAHRITLVSVAGEVSRAEARGDDAAATAALGQLGRDVVVEREHPDPLLCVTLISHPVRGILSELGVSARACAAMAGARR
ncbi:pilus assembly protein [Leucobacter insecticola]|uniref:Pilus assembly protein n=1 Tax=Leucobacter insecticola TaxID=2714934 RepID=A0A6G8FL73_9MICO|nr:TadE/TadG family type IV pilus assembly protein [Leucobacter insecticola]QIM17240.1 pilus assembly protein [Leucobacter insecticola]